MSTGKEFELVSNKLDFNARPTLVKDYVEFENTDFIQKIDIYDLSGKKVSSYLKPEKIIMMNQLKSGVYYIRIHTNDLSIRSIKVIKE
jgi:hypothetical protein